MGGIVSAIGNVVSSIFGGGDKPQAPAAITPAEKPLEAPTPTANNAAIEEARRKSLIKQSSTGGRASTILSGSDDKLGG